MSVWFVDGVDMDDAQGRWRVERGTAVPAPASRRVAQLELPRLDGVLTARQGWGRGTVRLSISIYDTANMAIEDACSVLTARFARASALTRVMPGGDRTVGVVSALVSEPQRHALTYWVVEVIFEVQPFWREVGNAATAPTFPIPGGGTLERWAGTTGDVVDGIIRVKGPATRVSITASDGTGVSFDTPITATQYVFIDVTRFRAWRGASSAWTPTSTPIALDWPAAGPIRLSPDDEGLVLAVSGQGLTSESNVTVRGSRYWL